MVTLDSPGANYRAVWAFSKNYPGVKIFARAHDINHGLNLEKAGATAGRLPTPTPMPVILTGNHPRGVLP